MDMRDSLDALLDIFHDRGKLCKLRDALERGGAVFLTDNFRLFGAECFRILRGMFPQILADSALVYP